MTSSNWPVPYINGEVVSSRTMPQGSEHPVRPSFGLSNSPWSREKKAIAKIESDARIARADEITQAMIRTLQAAIRKYEAMQVLRNGNELMDYAMSLAKDDPGKVVHFVNWVLQMLDIEMDIYRANHAPLLHRRLEWKQ